MEHVAIKYKMFNFDATNLRIVEMKVTVIYTFIIFRVLFYFIFVIYYLFIFIIVLYILHLTYIFSKIVHYTDGFFYRC